MNKIFFHHIRAVLFDLDGVIVRTDRFHEAGWRRMAEEEGWTFPQELAYSLRGISRMDALDRIAVHNRVTLDFARREELAERKNNYYKEFVKGISDSDILPGSLNFIHSLRAADIKTALCSASKNAPEVLQLLGIRDLFDELVCGLDISRSKPDPQVFLIASERLEIPPFHCVVFEDAPSGVEAARNAGMKCVGVGTAEDLPEAPSLIESYATIDIEALLDSGRPYRPRPHGWELREGAFRPARSLYWESMFAVTNGRIGVRGSLEEPCDKTSSYAATFMNGLVGYADYYYMWKFPGYPDRGHRVLNLCEWTRVSLEINGEAFSMNSPGIERHERWFDLRSGILHRKFQWTSSHGVCVDIATRRLASMSRKHFAAQIYSIRAHGNCEVRLICEIDAAPRSRHFPGVGMQCDAWEVLGETVVARQLSATSGQRARSVFHQQATGSTGVSVVSGAVCKTVFSRSLSAGDNLDLERVAAFYSDLDDEQDSDIANGMPADAPSAEILFEEQERYWNNYWQRNDIVIEGDDLDQLGVRLSLFHNRQSNPEDGLRSISANGQTGDNYGGHIFWDTEMYITQPFLYTEPESVRGLLEYRYRILDKAREQAGKMQGQGALYSWNSITGEECAHVYEASTAEYHLQSAIAWAVHRYVACTGDHDFLKDMGAEMVFETARFMRDRGQFIPSKGGFFCLNVVCGPNEYSCGVDNNAYTNYLARWHFEYAIEVYQRLCRDAPEVLTRLQNKHGFSEQEADGWREAASRMYLPWDHTLGIIPQDDQFLGRDPVNMDAIPLHTDIRLQVHPLNLWRMQLVKQADTVLLLFLFSHLFDAETARRTYDFHEARTNHGSSLSPCMHSIVANDIGKLEEAYHYFRESALMDINDLKDNTEGGVHSACMGGTWMAVVNGFGGMRDTPDGLVLNPKLPKSWTRLCFSFCYHGTRIRVEVTTKELELMHLDGPPLHFKVDGQTVQLGPDKKGFRQTRIQK